MSHNTGGGGVKQIEQHWVARVKAAQAHYQHALEHQERMIEELDHALMEGVDDPVALAIARRATALALNDLLRCEKVLVNLVLQPEIQPLDEVQQLP